MTCHDSYPEATTETGTTAGPARVLVGVDGSSSSRAALRWAEFMARSDGGYVEAVTAWQPAPTYAWASAYWGAAPGEWNPTDLAAVAEKLLTQTVDEVFGPDRPAGMVLTVVEGSAADALIQRSAEARMVVVGCRGHGGFAGMLLGSVSAACAEHATSPVLVVHGDRLPPA